MPVRILNCADFARWVPAVFLCAMLEGVLGADTNEVSAAAFPEAEAAAKRLAIAPGFKIEVFAAEPLLQNPVSFAFDEKGRAYVVETHRRRTSVFDIRNFTEWLDSDFALRTVDDRAAFLRRMVDPTNREFIDKVTRGLRSGGFADYNNDGKIDWQDLQVESERIRLLTDRDGDGRADTATTFSDGYNSIVSGVAAGVLARQNKVWFTCIPDLWLLEDRDGDRHAEVRTPLLHGFGVHIALGGHDMHGLKFGPDGKLYFSIADRGSHVEAGGRTFALPDEGAVFRCNPDGSDFEVFARGLRNPQELAFDEFGNLWTADNNGDGGDKARLVYVAEGSDSGWTIGWQWLPRMGAWNSEKLWHLAPTNSAAYLIPPVAHVGHGPAGFVYNPGTGMPREFDRHFFLADFPGGVRTFAVTSRGAGFAIESDVDSLQNNSPANMRGKILWDLSPVDVDFGPKPGVYIADWVQGWEKTGKGRIFRVFAPDVETELAVAKTWALLGEGMTMRSLGELARLLSHPDQRVRQEAQFELASRGGKSIRTLINVAEHGANQLARLHAIWALGQVSFPTVASPADTLPRALQPLRALLKDEDTEVRAQAAKVLGEARYSTALNPLMELLRDASPRVRFFAAQSLGKLHDERAIEPILAMLRENADGDAYLRHAGVVALVRIGNLESILKATHDNSKAVRMAALLALRRLGRSEVSRFLRDADPDLIAEAARAIHDLPIERSLAELAVLTEQTERFASASEPARDVILRRAINANFRLGGAEEAVRLVKFATSGATPESHRVDALEALANWARPAVRDRVVGLYRPLPERNAQIAAAALRAEIDKLLSATSQSVRIATVQAVAKLNLASASARLFEIVANTTRSGAERTATLSALAELRDDKLPEAVRLAMESKDPTLRREASRLQTSVPGGNAVSKLAATLQNGAAVEQQQALRSLAKIDDTEADRILAQTLDRLLANQLPKEIQLDALEAASQRTAPDVKVKLQKFAETRDARDALGEYRETLYGGDAQQGRKTFYERAEAACARCHKIGGEGGEVGPDLSDIGSKRDREYLLESILFPNKQIAESFQTLVITTTGEVTYRGVVKSENNTDLVLNSPEDGILTIKKNTIKSRDTGLSSMPEGMNTLLSKSDLRDLIEFLARPK